MQRVIHNAINYHHVKSNSVSAKNKFGVMKWYNLSPFSVQFCQCVHIVEANEQMNIGGTVLQLSHSYKKSAIDIKYNYQSYKKICTSL